MGVEYIHGLFVTDTTWRPAWHHVERIDAVLQHWGFRRADAAYHALVDAGADAISEDVARSMPSNLRVAYGALEGRRVPLLMGPSAYPDVQNDDDRYIASTSLCLGMDFKLIEVVGDCVWRSGVLLDCGKDIPAFAGKSKVMPAHAFVRNLEAAFSAALVEDGWFY